MEYGRVFSSPYVVICDNNGNGITRVAGAQPIIHGPISARQATQSARTRVDNGLPVWMLMRPLSAYQTDADPITDPPCWCS